MWHYQILFEKDQFGSCAVVGLERLGGGCMLCVAWPDVQLGSERNRSGLHLLGPQVWCLVSEEGKGGVLDD